MTEKTKRVYAGYLKLSDDEKKEVEEAIRRFRGLSANEKLTETTRGVILGPVGGGCPCCGK